MIAIAIVGMPGAGKSEVSKVFEENGFSKIRFGDITDEEVAKRGLELNETNEKIVREALRKEHGIAAYAKLNISKIDAALEKGNVAIDGLYSWEEFLVLKEKYREKLKILAVYAALETRQRRLAERKIRPLTAEEVKSRDKAEIENLNKGGPIAIADYALVNEDSLEELRKETKEVVEKCLKE